nr:MAG TPA: hypothetical protein [Caudoviricetes sp.]
MGCTKCGTDLSSLHLIVKDIIRQLIDEGKLQEGLVDCTDKRLWRDSRVLTCDLLGDAVCQLITNGDICLVKPEALTVEKQDNGSHKISLLMSDGTKLDTTARLADGVLNSVTYDAKTKIAKFTTTNGDSYEIKLEIPEPVEYTFTTKDNGDIEVANGKKVVLATIPAIKVKAVKKANGDVVITNQDGSTVEIEKPAEFDLSKHVDNKSVRLKDGKLEVIKEKCAVATNLSTLEASDGTLKQLGNTCFTGLYSATSDSATLGVPVALDKTDVETSNAVNAKSDAVEGIELDFNGWQIATDSEVTQYIYTRVEGGKQSGWVRSNESGMNEDGTLKNPNDWGKWVYELNLPEQPVQKGLDCDAIDALPQVGWKKGTVVLAKQDGRCVRLAALDSIFQEIGVGINADKTNTYTGEDYNVVVTVTNTGEGKNDLTNLNIVGPANIEDYEIKNVTFSQTEAATVEKINDLTYDIRDLKRGGVVNVRFTVTPKKQGNFQFTASVNPNTAFDKDLGNNSATIILSAIKKQTAVVSENCPPITLTDLGTNTVLAQQPNNYAPGTGFSSRTANITVLAADNRELQYGANIFKNLRTLQGLRLKFDSDVTVLATGVKADSLAKDLRAVGINRVSTYEPIRAKLVNGFGTYTTRLDPDTVFTFESNPADGTVMSLPIDGDNVLTVTEDIKSLVIAARPRGANCFWQTWYLAATTPMKFRGPTVSNVADAVETSAITPTESGNLIDAMLETVNVIPSGRDNLSVSRGSWNKKVILKVKSGIPASADINWGDIQPVLSSGLVTITNNKIAVAAGAKATDSIRSQYLDVIIEE